MSPHPAFSVAVLSAVLTTGCTLTRLDDEVKAFDASTVLVGRVEPGNAPAVPVIVGAWAGEGRHRRLVHQTRLHEPGGYELIVPHGRYRVVAFADLDGDGSRDDGEPAAMVEATARPGEALVAGLDLVLGTTSAPLPRGAPAGPHSTQAGAIADLDAAALSAVSGVNGYWQPLAFFRTLGGNVYFLEPYDAAKTPVLFVHGAAGSPQDWRYQIDHLDRSRYQPWIFFYPSGAPAESMASLLGWKLLNLQLRYRFDRLAIVAHSMGGLIVRRFLLDQGSILPQIRRFISISTPWGGEVSADMGVRMSPAVVPSWRDMQPEGPFIQSLFSRRLPSTIEYDLLFGHKGGYSLWRPNHDGTVTLASQLRPAAQAEARRTLGFDEDHTGILHSPQLTTQLHVLLAADPGSEPHGMMEVALDVEAALPLGLPTLVLQPLGQPAQPVAVVLSTAQRGGRVGPVPAGRYRAGLIAPGFAAEPRLQEVAIGADPLPVLRFKLRPEGSLGGFVQTAHTRPAGSLGLSRTVPTIRRITLHGAGVERTLEPGDGDGSMMRMAAGEDSASGASFQFGALAPGDYELTILADGHALHRSQHRVVPGAPPPTAAIVLEPLR